MDEDAIVAMLQDGQRGIAADALDDFGRPEYAADLRDPVVGPQVMGLYGRIRELGSRGTIREFFSCVDTIRAFRLLAGDMWRGIL